MGELKQINFSWVIGFKGYFEKTQVPTKKQLRFVGLKLEESFGHGCINKNNSCSWFARAQARQAKKL